LVISQSDDNMMPSTTFYNNLDITEAGTITLYAKNRAHRNLKYYSKTLTVHGLKR
jgi:hypothetical protein